MTNIQISQLLDGRAIRGRTSEAPFEQGGITYKDRDTPGLTRQINISSQAQLEAEFGVNIEIPDGDKVTIVYESFALEKPIFIGLGSVLELRSATIEDEISYEGIGAMFQRTNILNDIRALILNDVFILGDLTQLLCDLKGTSRLFITGSRIEGFKGSNTEFPFTKFDNLAAVNWTEGWLFRNPSSLNISNSNLRQSSSPGVTFLSIITNVICNVVIGANFSSTLQPSDSLIFFDPNAPAGSAFTISGTAISDGDFYQLGPQKAISSVADNGGVPRFTSTSHALLDRQVTVLKDFITEPTYNGTFKVKVIDANTFDVEELTFTGNDTGNVNASSLDSTDVRVSASDNPMQPDSMFTGNAGLEIAAPITVTINTISIPEVITDVNWATNNLERFEDDVTTPNQGRLITKDLSTRRYSVTYSGTINKSGGPGTNVGIVLLKQVGGTGPLINISNNAPRVFITTTTPLTRTEIVELAENDVIQVGVINYVDTNDIDVYQANLEVNRA